MTAKLNFSLDPGIRCTLCLESISKELPILTHGMSHGYDPQCLISWLAHEKENGRVSNGRLRCPFYPACQVPLSEKNVMKFASEEMKKELEDKLKSSLSEKHLVFKMLNYISLIGIIASIFMLIFSGSEGSTKTFSDSPLSLLVTSVIMCLVLNSDMRDWGSGFSPVYPPADDIEPIQF